jgi:CheY-like chemotaxis protein
MGAPEQQLLLMAAEGPTLEDLLKKFSRDPLLSRIPVVLACYPPEYADYCSRFAQFNIKRIIEKPVDYRNISNVIDGQFESEIRPTGDPQSDENPRSASDTSAPAAFATSLLKPTILVAEDNDINMKVISDYFTEKKWNILQCRNGKEALEQFLLHSATIDAVLMDIQMPIMDGFDTIQKLRSASGNAGAKVPIIAMTAYAMSSDRERCFRAGADDYVTKPISSMEELAKLIERNIYKSGLQKTDQKTHGGVKNGEKKGIKNRAKIVIAEDENINRMYLQRIIEKAGYKVIGTKDGDKAFSSIKKELPQIAILDLQLPNP